MLVKKSVMALAVASLLMTGGIWSPAPAKADKLADGSIVTTLSSGPTTNTGLELYVDGSVATGGDGSKDAPYKTMTQVRDAIRAKNGALPTGGITVWVKGGTYKFPYTFELNASDSGSAGKTIVYRTFPGEKVILSNGVGVEPSMWQPLNADAQKRVNPKISASNLVELDARALGLSNINEYPGGTSFSDRWGIVDLIVDHERQPVSQWPNADEMAGNTRTGWTTANGSADASSFYYGTGGIPADGDTTDALNADGTNRAQRWQKVSLPVMICICKGSGERHGHLL